MWVHQTLVPLEHTMNSPLGGRVMTQLNFHRFIDGTIEGRLAVADAPRGCSPSEGTSRSQETPGV